MVQPEGQAMVGRDGLEPSTSRLSGVCSNHLSYRPIEPANLLMTLAKGYEDGPAVICDGLRDHLLSRSTIRASPDTRIFLRKEVIQPQVPLRLPCYDFTPVAEPTVVRCLP